LVPAALYGVAGEFVRLIEPHTEADPAALLIQFLTMAGSVFGRGRYFAVEADLHHCNLFAALVGDSSKARKGVSKGQALAPFERLDPSWARERLQSGLSSGEGLIWGVRDGRVSDKRLLVFEPEFASVLRVIGREGNTLSAVVRDSWDRGSLRILTKKSPATATGAHISIIGHITAEELRAELTRTDAASGFGNRFLWVCARRSKLLPDGGRLHEVDFGTVDRALGKALEFARLEGEIKRDAEARERWINVYEGLSEGQPGLFGAVTSRAEAQVVRLSLIYALLDCSTVIKLPHLEAAVAVWRYCEASAAHVFGSALGDPIGDEILRALLAAPAGLTRNEIRDLLGRHRRSEEIGGALERLSRLRRAHFVREETPGRPAERWFASPRGCAESAVSAKRSDPSK
jgi:hypothetical protein